MLVDLNKSQDKNLPADFLGVFQVLMNLLIAGVGKCPNDKTMSGTGGSPSAVSSMCFTNSHKTHKKKMFSLKAYGVLISVLGPEKTSVGPTLASKSSLFTGDPWASAQRWD